MANAMRRLLLTAAVIATLGGAGSQPSVAQVIGRAVEPVGRGPINPSRSPRIDTGRPLIGLDQEKLSSYRDQIENRLEQDRMSGRATTANGARQMRNLEGELGRVDGAMNGH